MLDKPALAVLGATAIFWCGILLVARQPAKPATPQEVAATRTAEANEQEQQYAKSHARCMSERPGSDDRADCLWDAEQGYPQGRLLFIRRQLLDTARANGYDVEIVTKQP